MRFRSAIALCALGAGLVTGCGDIQDTTQVQEQVVVTTTEAPTTTTTVDPTPWYEALEAQHRWWSIVQWFEVARWNENAAVLGQRQQSSKVQQVDRRPSTAAATSTGWSCAIPAWICWRESRNNPRAQNPISSASGPYQMLDTSFATAVRGAGYPQYAGMHAKDAPLYVQDAAARWLWAETGGSAWACC